MELYRTTFSAPLSDNAKSQLAAWKYSQDPSVGCADAACQDAAPRVIQAMYDAYVDSVKPLLLLQVGARRCWEGAELFGGGGLRPFPGDGLAAGWLQAGRPPARRRRRLAAREAGRAAGLPAGAALDPMISPSMRLQQCLHILTHSPLRASR